jgi:hypothetical protein
MEEVTVQSEPENITTPRSVEDVAQQPAAPDTLTKRDEEGREVLFVTLAEAARRRQPPVSRAQMSDLLRRRRLPDPQDFKQGGKVYIRWGSVEEYEENKPVGGRPTKSAAQNGAGEGQSPQEQPTPVAPEVPRLGT